MGMAIPVPSPHKHPHPNRQTAGNGKEGEQTGGGLGGLRNPYGQACKPKSLGQERAAQAQLVNHNQGRFLRLSPAGPWPFLCFSGRPRSC